VLNFIAWSGGYSGEELSTKFAGLIIVHVRCHRPKFTNFARQTA
jgi:hypothetical protein